MHFVRPDLSPGQRSLRNLNRQFSRAQSDWRLGEGTFLREPELPLEKTSLRSTATDRTLDTLETVELLRETRPYPIRNPPYSTEAWQRRSKKDYQSYPPVPALHAGMFTDATAAIAPEHRQARFHMYRGDGDKVCCPDDPAYAPAFSKIAGEYNPYKVDRVGAGPASPRESVIPAGQHRIRFEPSKLGERSGPLDRSTFRPESARATAREKSGRSPRSTRNKTPPRGGERSEVGPVPVSALREPDVRYTPRTESRRKKVAMSRY